MQNDQIAGNKTFNTINDDDDDDADPKKDLEEELLCPCSIISGSALGSSQ